MCNTGSGCVLVQDCAARGGNPRFRRANTEGRVLELHESSTVDLPPPIHHSHSPSPLALFRLPPPRCSLSPCSLLHPSSLPILERSVSIRPYHFPHSPPLLFPPPYSFSSCPHHFLQVEESILHARWAGGGSDYWVG